MKRRGSPFLNLKHVQNPSKFHQQIYILVSTENTRLLKNLFKKKMLCIHLPQIRKNKILWTILHPLARLTVAVTYLCYQMRYAAVFCSCAVIHTKIEKCLHWREVHVINLWVEAVRDKLHLLTKTIPQYLWHCVWKSLQTNRSLWFHLSLFQSKNTINHQCLLQPEHQAIL